MARLLVSGVCSIDCSTACLPSGARTHTHPACPQPMAFHHLPASPSLPPPLQPSLLFPLPLLLPHVLLSLHQAYEDLSGVLGRISLCVNGVPPGGEPGALREVQELLQQHTHVTPFDTTTSTTSSASSTATAAAVGDPQQQQQQRPQHVSVLEATMGNLGALERSLAGWEARLRSHHTPSRVLKWTSSGTG